jgi:hypothetical protein
MILPARAAMVFAHSGLTEFQIIKYEDDPYKRFSRTFGAHG